MRCLKCGFVASKNRAQCPVCRSWNVTEENFSEDGFSGPVPLSGIPALSAKKYSTGLVAFDHVLTGGVIESGAYLIPANPGIGKSTAVLQMLAHLVQIEFAGARGLYVTVEETPTQTKLRAKRVLDSFARIDVQAYPEWDAPPEEFSSYKVIAFDSLQQDGGPYLARAHSLVDMAKQNGQIIFMISTVNSEGVAMGMTALRHAPDAVIYIERATKNKNDPARRIWVEKHRFGEAPKEYIDIHGSKGFTRTK